MATVEEIYEDMITCFTQNTGMELVDSCDLAVRFYAVAAQIEGLYHQADWVVTQCFPQTATGEYLDYHGQLRGLTRKEAACATGTLRFYASGTQEVDRTIPLGTVGLTAGLVRFETTQEGTLPAGDSYVDVPATASEAGTGGNVSAGAVISMSVAPVGVSQCSNPEAFDGGTDEEDDDSLRERVVETYRRLANGVNEAYYEQEALAFDSVAAVTVISRHEGVGTVKVVVASYGGVP